MLLINSLHGTSIPVFDDVDESTLPPDQQYETKRRNVLKAFNVIRESEACIAEHLLDLDSSFLLCHLCVQLFMT